MSQLKKDIPTVVFATHAYGDARTGPAVYARYLWEAFRDDPEIRFHLVSPDGPNNHRCSHLFRPTSSSARCFYRTLLKSAHELAQVLKVPGILHLNAPHYGSVRALRGWQLWLQLNDYEGPHLFRSMLDNLQQNGLRRLLALSVRRWYERRALRICDLALANSEYTRSEFLSAYPEIPREKIQTLYKAVDTDFFKGVRAPVASTAGRRFVFLGSNFKIKRLNIALEAFARLDSIQSTLAIAGCELPEFIRAYPVLSSQANDTRVRFYGRLSRAEVKDLLLRSDVLVLPSRQEGLGVAALEAIACGCRVLASRTGGLPEIVRNSDIGRLIDDSSPHAWTQAMRQELTTISLTDSMKDVALKHFTAENMIGRLRDLYLKTFT